MGILLLHAALVPLQELLVAQGNGASRTGHLTLMSPAVLLKNALGFALATGSVTASSARTWISLLVVVTLALVLAFWVFLRAQGVETWEASRAQRWVIALGLGMMVIVPAVIADTDYDQPAPPNTNAPAIRGLFSRAGSSLGLTPPGGRLPERCCSTILNRDEWPAISADRVTRRDLFVLLPVDARQTISDVRLEVAGENGLNVSTDAGMAASMPGRLETRTYPSGLGPTGPDGTHLETGWMLRVPVDIEPTHPWDTGGMRYPLNVTATYRVAGESEPRVLKARGAIEARISSALYEMAVASAVLPLICLTAAFVRWRRTR
jgi:hypothetical protein